MRAFPEQSLHIKLENGMSYLRYTPDVEKIDEDESKLFAQIAETFRTMGAHVAKEEGQTVRVSHAKATAIVKGELIVDDGLPPELAQGLAGEAKRCEIVVRFAQGPGELLHDRISTHRGMSIKIKGLAGTSIPESVEPGTQDLVLEARGKAFINSTATTFLANLKAGVSNAPLLPESVKNAVSKTALATETALEAVGLESKTLGFFGHPSVHPLSEAYFSQVPMRWGDYIAKIGVFPAQTMLDRIGDATIEAEDDRDAFRTAMMEYFHQNGADYELRVQLATDTDDTPIEDAAQEWPEDKNPYRRVGRIELPAQPAWSDENATIDEKLSFRPANSLQEHRPLGQVMRARLFVYGRLADWRRQRQGVVVPA